MEEYKIRRYAPDFAQYFCSNEQTFNEVLHSLLNYENDAQPLLDNHAAYLLLKDNLMHFKFHHKAKEFIIDKLDDNAQQTKIPPYYITINIFDMDYPLKPSTFAKLFYEKTLKDGFHLLGDLTCAYYLGRFYYQPRFGINNYEEAFNYFEECAKVKDIHGHAMVGKFYYEGLGVQKDLAKAFENLNKVALTQTNAESMMLIADMYRYGEYVEKDERVAYYIYTLALDVKDNDLMDDVQAEILLRLGDCNYYGTGINKDYEKALTYYTYAETHYYDLISQGYKGIRLRLDYIASQKQHILEHYEAEAQFDPNKPNFDRIAH